MVVHSFSEINMVKTPKSLFKLISFLVCHPVAIPVATLALGRWACLTRLGRRVRLHL